MGQTVLEIPLAMQWKKRKGCIRHPCRLQPFTRTLCDSAQHPITPGFWQPVKKQRNDPRSECLPARITLGKHPSARPFRLNSRTPPEHPVDVPVTTQRFARFRLDRLAAYLSLDPRQCIARDVPIRMAAGILRFAAQNEETPTTRGCRGFGIWVKIPSLAGVVWGQNPNRPGFTWRRALLRSP